MKTFTPRDVGVVWRELRGDLCHFQESWALSTTFVIEQEKECRLEFLQVVIGAEDGKSIAVWKKLACHIMRPKPKSRCLRS